MAIHHRHGWVFGCHVWTGTTQYLVDNDGPIVGQGEVSAFHEPHQVLDRVMAFTSYSSSSFHEVFKAFAVVGSNSVSHLCTQILHIRQNFVVHYGHNRFVWWHLIVAVGRFRICHDFFHGKGNLVHNWRLLHLHVGVAHNTGCQFF